jgi:hypothetical protein
MLLFSHNLLQFWHVSVYLDHCQRVTEHQWSLYIYIYRINEVYIHMFIYKFYWCWVTPRRWSRQNETCWTYNKLCGQKYNFNISAFVGFILCIDNNGIIVVVPVTKFKTTVQLN